jgi:hypothetical protein
MKTRINRVCFGSIAACFVLNVTIAVAFAVQPPATTTTGKSEREGFRREKAIPNGGQFTIATGETAVLKTAGMGKEEITLVSSSADGVVLGPQLAGGFANEKIALGEYGKPVHVAIGDTLVARQTEEQAVLLTLISTTKDGALFSARFGSAPPAPPIPDGQTINVSMYTQPTLCY